MYLTNIEDNYSWSMYFLNYWAQRVLLSYFMLISFTLFYLILLAKRNHNFSNEIFCLFIDIIIYSKLLFYIRMEILIHKFHNSLHIFLNYQKKNAIFSYCLFFKELKTNLLKFINLQLLQLIRQFFFRDTLFYNHMNVLVGIIF